MENKQYEKLVQELNKLSENEIKNKARMLEIAKVLVAHLMGKDKK